MFILYFINCIQINAMNNDNIAHSIYDTKVSDVKLCKQKPWYNFIVNPLKSLLYSDAMNNIPFVRNIRYIIRETNNEIDILQNKFAKQRPTRTQAAKEALNSISNLGMPIKSCSAEFAMRITGNIIATPQAF